MSVALMRKGGRHLRRLAASEIGHGSMQKPAEVKTDGASRASAPSVDYTPAEDEAPLFNRKTEGPIDEPLLMALPICAMLDLGSVERIAAMSRRVRVCSDEVLFR